MSTDMFIKINGIEGESQDDKHKNEIDVEHWEWHIIQESNLHSGRGGGAGKATVGDIIFEHFVDRSSPNLLKYCLTGKPIDEVVLTTRKAGGKPLDYVKIIMNEVLVTELHPISDGNGPIREQVALSFARVRHEYALQNPQGGSAGTIATGFDIKANREL